MGLTFDTAGSRVVVRTFAEGMLSRLAHDLEIEAGGAEGHVDDAGRAKVRFPVARLRVRGVVRSAKVDAEALSASDRADIERRIAEAFEGVMHVEVEGELAGDRAKLRVTCGRRAQELEVPASVERGEGGRVRVKGKAKLSHKSLGLTPVRGPLGAFRVADGVEVTFDVVFV